MRTILLLNVLRYNPVVWPQLSNKFSKYNNILPRYFATSSESSPSVDSDYYNDLVEKTKPLFEKISFSESELLHNKDVIVYVRNRTCSKCNKTVKNSHPEFIEDVCADTWRYFHNFSYVPNCPIYGISRFTKYSRLRTEQKLLLSSNNSDTQN